MTKLNMTVISHNLGLLHFLTMHGQCFVKQLRRGPQYVSVFHMFAVFSRECLYGCHLKLFKVYKSYAYFSLPFRALFNDISESEHNNNLFGIQLILFLTSCLLLSKLPRWGQTTRWRLAACYIWWGHLSWEWYLCTSHRECSFPSICLCIREKVYVC